MASENVETVRRIYEGWAEGDFSDASWADPEIEVLFPESHERTRGLADMAAKWGDWLSSYDRFRIEPEETLDEGERVTVLCRFCGRGKRSGLPVEDMRGVSAFTFRDGRVIRLDLYSNRARAFEELGIEPES